MQKLNKHKQAGPKVWFIMRSYTVVYESPHVYKIMKHRMFTFYTKGWSPKFDLAFITLKMYFEGISYCYMF